MKYTTWSGYLLLLIPPVLYYVFFFTHALNVPVGDDFIVIIRFLIHWDWARTAVEKWQLLTSNFIEHRLVYTRLSALVVRAILQQLDFRAVMLLGNIHLLGVLALLSIPLLRHRLSIWYCLPISLLLFQPIAYEGNFWAIASTNYMPVSCLCMLTLLLLSSSNRVVNGLAVLVAVAASLTFANGLMAWAAGWFVLLLQRRFRALAIWTVVSAAAIWVYYLGYSYDNSPDIVAKLVEQKAFLLVTFFSMVGALANPNDKIHFFGPGDYIQVFTGVLLSGWLVFIIGRSLLGTLNAKLRPQWLADRYMAYLVGCAAFLLISCAAFALGRSFGGAIITESRYRNFSLFIVALSYVLAVLLSAPTLRPKVGVVAGVLTLLFSLSSYFLYTPRLEAMQTNVKAGLYNWEHNRYWAIYRNGGYYNTVADSTSILIEQYATDWYRFPDLANPITAADLKTDAALVLETDTIGQNKRVQLTFFNSARVKGEPYGVLVTNDTLWLFGAQRQSGILRLLDPAERQLARISSSILLSAGLPHDLPKGEYQVGMALVNKGEVTYAALKPKTTFRVGMPK